MHTECTECTVCIVSVLCVCCLDCTVVRVWNYTVLYCVYYVRVCEEYGILLFGTVYTVEEYVKSTELYCTVFTM